MKASPIDILKKYWGHNTFRPLQEEVISEVLKGNDVLTLMPTGGGKSVCFQIPALARPGICIVISPLIALIEDQVSQLKNRGIKATSLTSGLSKIELETRLNNANFGNYKFLYLSPERLQQDLVRNRIQQMNVNLIVIDEAHCISEWGHDFRPAYLKLHILKDILPNVSVIALTATATKRVQQDIITQLKITNPKFFKTSYLRKNLSYGVYKTQDKNLLLLQILQKQKGAAIVYVATRNQTTVISDLLREANLNALPYHGGLDSELKKKHFELWFTNDAPIIVATNAFGMGIDKTDVRLVIHLHLPESIEHYFQETGRAGRDGQQAFALLLQTANTSQKLITKFESQNPDLKFIKHVYRKLSSYLQIGYGEGVDKKYSLQFSDFCNRYDLQKSKTYNTLQILDNNSIIRVNEVFGYTSEIKFLLSPNALQSFLNNNTKYTAICELLSRNYPGIYSSKVIVNLSKVSSKLAVSQNKTHLLLKKLAEREIILFEPKKNDLEITYLQPREDDFSINAVSKYIKKHLKYKRKKVANVLEFLALETHCKSKFLLNYFGEEANDCGICSACIKKKKKVTTTYKDAENTILKILTEKEMDSRNLIAKLPIFESSILIESLKSLLEQNKITIHPDNTYGIKR